MPAFSIFGKTKLNAEFAGTAEKFDLTLRPQRPLRLSLKNVEDFLVDAAKAAVGHDRDNVAFA